MSRKERQDIKDEDRMNWLRDRHEKVRWGCDEKGDCPLSHERNRHKRAFIRMLKNRRLVSVDAGLVPLLRLMWKSGAHTRMSCENNNPRGYVWLYFSRAKPASLFMDRICKTYSRDKAFMARVLEKSTERSWRSSWCTVDLSPRVREKWRKGLGWWDSEANVFIRNLRVVLQAQRVAAVSIRFPHSDYHMVLGAFA